MSPANGNDYISSLPDEEIIKIESQLFKNYAKFAAIVDSSNDAIVSVDNNNTIVSWNRAAKLIYGYEGLGALGKNIVMLWPEEDADEIMKLREQVAKGEIVKDYEVAHVKNDGSRVFVSLSFSPIKDEKGETTGFSMIGRDITEKKLNEQKLSKFDEVTRLNRLMIDRELRMVELKEKIKELEDRLQAKS